MKRTILFSLAVLTFGLSARSAEPALASLFPSSTFAYAEIRDPSLIAVVWAGYVKGTPLDGSSLNTSAERLDQLQSPNQLPAHTSLGQIGMLASPEFQREVKKFKGVAVGATRIQVTGNADYLAVLQTGDSTAVGLITRLILSTHPEFRRVSSNGDTPIYQVRPLDIGYTNEGIARFNDSGRPKPTMNVPTFAYRAGLLVLGSNLADVTEALKRFEGKGDGKGSLADSERFIASRSMQNPQSLFVLATPRTAFADWEKVALKRGEADDSDFAAWLRFVVNPKAVTNLAATLSFGRDGWTGQCQIETDPTVSSPLLGLIADGSVNQPTYRESGITWKLNDRSGERLLSFADSIAKAMGTVGRLPSDVAKKAEKETGTKWKSELLPAVESIALLPPGRGEANAKSVLIVTFTNAERADQWERAMPGLLRAADPSDKPVTPSEETVDTVLVRSYAVTFLQLSTVHSARKGNRIVYALSRETASKVVRIEPNGTQRNEAVTGYVPLERLMNNGNAKPQIVKPPLLPPQTLKDAFSPLPDLQFSVVRLKEPSRIVIQFDHRGWVPGEIKRSVTSFANWWEKSLVEKNANGSDLPGGGGIILR